MPRKKPKPPESPGAVAPEVAPAGKREAHAGVGWLRLALVPSAGAAGAAASARSVSASSAGAPRVYLHASDMQDAAVGAGDPLCVMGAAGERTAEAGAAVVVGTAWPGGSVRRGQAVILPPRWSLPLFQSTGSAAGPRDARSTSSVDVVAWRAQPHATQQLGAGGADCAQGGGIRDAATLSVALLDRPADELEADDGALAPAGDAGEPERAEPSAAAARTEAAVSAAALGSVVCAPTDGVARSFVPFALRGRRRRAVVLGARPTREHFADIANTSTGATSDGSPPLDAPPSAASPVSVRVQIPVGLQVGDEVVIALPTGLARSRVPPRGAGPHESTVDVPLPATVRAVAADASSSLPECAHALPDLDLLRVTTETKVLIVGSAAEESAGPTRQDAGVASTDRCRGSRAIHRDGPGHEFVDRAHDVVAVGGLEDARRELRELVLLPLKRPRLYSESFGVPAPRGALLHGPRGTGEWARSAREAWLSNDTPRARAGASAPPQANPRCSTSSRRMRCRCLLRLSKAVARVRSRRGTETMTTRRSRSCGCAPTTWSPSRLETARTTSIARRPRRRARLPQHLPSRRRRNRPSFCLMTRTVCSLHNLAFAGVARRRPPRLASRPCCDGSAARCARHAQAAQTLFSLLLLRTPCLDWQLLSHLDALHSRVFVLAACADAASLDADARRAGRLQRSLALSVPDEAARARILEARSRLFVVLVRARVTPGFRAQPLLARLPLEAAISCDLSDDDEGDNAGDASSNAIETERLSGCGSDAVSETALAANLAGRTHGFVGADLALMCKQALIVALRRRWKQQEETGRTDGGALEGDDPSMEDAEASRWLSSRLAPSSLEARGSLSVTAADLKAAARSIAPSALRDLVVEVPKTRWRDVGGQEEVKQALREVCAVARSASRSPNVNSRARSFESQVVEWPLLHPEAFSRFGVRPARGVLLYGPPGPPGSRDAARTVLIAR